MERNKLLKLELNYYEEKLVVSSLVKVMQEGSKKGHELLVSNVKSLLRKLEQANLKQYQKKLIMTINKHIQDLKYYDTNIVVEYTFIESELDYFSGTGQKDDVEIIAVYVDNVDITRLMEVHFSELETIVLNKHLGNL